MTDIEHLLRQGITAAKAGDTEHARALLTQITSLDETNAQAWLWLSGVSKTLDARLSCLERALVLRPDDTKIQQALHAVRVLQAKQWMQQGVEALEAGERAQAESLLMKAVEYDEESVAAWWWLGQSVDSLEDKVVCFENVLALDPDYTEAHEALTAIERGREVSETLEFETYVPPKEPHLNIRADVAPVPPEMPSAAIFADTLQCPYCASVTEFGDRRCETCGHQLWIRRRVVGRITTSYCLAVALEIILVLASALLPLLLLVYVKIQLELENIFWLFQRYWENADVASSESASAFMILPPILFWLSLVPILLSVLAVMSILSRWHPLFFAAMSFEGLRLFLMLVSLILVLFGVLGNAFADVSGYFIGVGYRFLRIGIIGNQVLIVILSGLSLSLLMKVMDHFSVENRRILLRLDRDLEPSGLSYQLRGSEYIKLKMWALAALHLRRALTFEERVEAYAQLAVAYAHLEFKDMAARALVDARRLGPESPQLAQLASLLAEQHGIEVLL